jgi:hypothetical protein
MKPKSGKPSMPDHQMKHFTPELYMRYNSADDKIGDRADEEWEQAIENYHRHLQALPLTENVKKLSQQCFHDALILDKTIHPARLLFPPFSPQMKVNSGEFGGSWITPHVTTMLLQHPNHLIQLFYSGTVFEPLSVDHAPEWSLWESAKRWLYDEIDVADDEPRVFIHRILWSDGSVLAIPFGDVSIVSVPLRHPMLAPGSDVPSATRA